MPLLRNIIRLSTVIRLNQLNQALFHIQNNYNSINITVQRIRQSPEQLFKYRQPQGKYMPVIGTLCRTFEQSLEIVHKSEKKHHNKHTCEIQ